MTRQPNDINASLLRRIAAEGIDLESPRIVDFEHCFPNETSARGFLAAVTSTVLEAHLKPPDPRHSRTWEVQCRERMVPTHTAITNTETRLAKVAAGFGGHADGWGFLSEPDGSPAAEPPAVTHSASTVLGEHRSEVVQYLRERGFATSKVGEAPAWHALPNVSIWSVEGTSPSGAKGLWVIAGDLPTDHVDLGLAGNAREGLHAFLVRWREVASYLRRGAEHPTIELDVEADREELIALLAWNTDRMESWWEDESLWRD